MIADRVKEFSTSTTGAFTLSIAVTAYELQHRVRVGASFDYCIETVDGTNLADHKIGRGHHPAPLRWCAIPCSNRQCGCAGRVRGCTKMFSARCRRPINALAPLASPGFAHTTAPTPTAGDNDTSS
jgi:hypothetical protein